MGSKDLQREVQHHTEQMSRVTIASRTSTLPGVIREVSRNNMELTLGESANIGSPLKVEMPGVSAGMKVTYCRPDGAKRFRVGVQALDVRSSTPLQHPARDLIAFYALGRGLVPSETLQILAHLKNCSVCGHAVDAMEWVLMPLKTSVARRPFPPPL